MTEKVYGDSDEAISADVMIGFGPHLTTWS